MKKHNAPLFISFKWCLIPCFLYTIISVLIKSLVFKPLPIFFIWFLAKLVFVVTNIDYIKRCEKSERMIWKQYASDNIKFDKIQKKYPSTTLLKKVKDSLLLSNVVTILFLLCEILKLI